MKRHAVTTKGRRGPDVFGLTKNCALWKISAAGGNPINLRPDRRSATSPPVTDGQLSATLSKFDRNGSRNRARFALAGVRTFEVGHGRQPRK